MQQLSLKEIEELKGSYETLQRLDKEVLTLQKMATNLAYGEKQIKLTLNVKDLLEKEVVEEEESDSIFSYPFIGARQPKELKEGEQIVEEINDVFAIELINFLLQVKEKQRIFILNKFEKKGIKI